MLGVWSLELLWILVLELGAFSAGFGFWDFSLCRQRAIRIHLHQFSGARLVRLFLQPFNLSLVNRASPRRGADPIILERLRAEYRPIARTHVDQCHL